MKNDIVSFYCAIQIKFLNSGLSFMQSYLLHNGARN